MAEKVTIQTERPAAAPWNGKSGDMVRPVEAPDPAYNEKVNQVVVAIDGEEVYFFADEVVGYEPKADEPKPTEPTEPALNPAPGQPLQPGIFNPPTPAKPQG